MNVLSLFDGISCGQVALERAGIKVDNYYASEDEGTLICELTGNTLVEPDGTEVNITVCENYKSDNIPVINYIEMQPLPF